MALPIFAITIFVSAFLLFLVQPLIGKLILPSLGGTPQVWNTCMVFFQSVLLLGYAYTHSVSTRLKLRQQLLVHSCLLALPILTMLIFPIYTTVKGTETTAGWYPPPGANPIFQTLLLLATIIGIPFFVVSTSAPLLQKWFGYSGHETARDPYYLYSVSNLGSLLSLFFYPALIEPYSLLQDQAYIWFGGYVLLAGLILYCAFTIYKLAPPDEQILATEAAAAAAAEAPPAPAPAPETAPAPAPAPTPAPAASTALKSGPAPGSRIRGKKGKHHHGPAAAAKHDEAAPSIHEPAVPEIAKGANAEMTWWRRIRWVLLAAVPSSMMLGVTSYISTDLSPFPLVWIVPLALYLLSFIIVYEKWMKWTSKRYFGVPGYTLHQMMVYVGQPLGILILCYIALRGGFDPVGATFMIMIGFFANALACHGELAEDRPDTKHLTEYFLLMSFGGMLGGVFNGLIAPVVFQQGVLEFYIVIAVACVVRPLYVTSGWFDELILGAFPGFQTWVRGQGDEMAKSMGRPAPRTTYLFSAFLDLVLGLFVMSIAYWLHTTDKRVSVFKFVGVTQDWRTFAINLWLYAIPMAFCFFFAGRPFRMAFAVGGLLLGAAYLGGRDDRGILESRRTYFGVLRVATGFQYPLDEEEKILFRRALIKDTDGEMRLPPFRYSFLMHGTTYHGRNYYFEKDKDLSRLATTYYHRYGPVGIVMERDNWYTRPSTPAPRGSKPGEQNDFSADTRLPVAMIGDIMGAALGGGSPLLPAVVQCWTEPPLATIGLGTGTMVAYARPYQHFTYYEIDDAIKHFSLPEDDRPTRFTFLENALRRGVNVELVMGDARQSLEPRREKDNLKNAFVYSCDFSKIDEKAGDGRPYGAARYSFESRANLAPKDRENLAPYREKYYKAINVDAFSSDAIPIHLVTKQAIENYMRKIRDDGVLMVHTSNRHMDLVRPVARIVMELSKEAEKRGEPALRCLVGKDDGSTEDPDQRRRETFYMGHYGSEYVMVFRDVGSEKTKEAKEARTIENFGAWQAYLEAKKEEFTKNLKEAKDKKQDSGKIMMKADAGMHAPEGWQILNSIVLWYNPFEDQFINRGDGRRFQFHRKVTEADSLWTDDYSHILSVVRWHFPWD